MMKKFEGQNILDFMKAFPDDSACRAYLADLKWEDGFECSKCGHTKGCRKKITATFAIAAIMLRPQQPERFFTR